MTKEKKNDLAESGELDLLFEEALADGCCTADDCPDDDGNVDSPDDVDMPDDEEAPAGSGIAAFAHESDGADRVSAPADDTTAGTAEAEDHTEGTTSQRVTYAQSATDKILLEVITEALSLGEGVNLQGLGFLSVKRHAGRKGRNPQTGETMQIPPANRVHFKQATALRDLLNRES